MQDKRQQCKTKERNTRQKKGMQEKREECKKNEKNARKKR